jgi:hypothetical protein
MAILTFPFMPRTLPSTPENLAAVSQFFTSPMFARFAVAATNKTNFTVNMHVMAAVMGMLKKYIARLASRLPCSAVALIFEGSERGDPLVLQHFGELGLLENEPPVPTEHCFMPKFAGEPGLEVADFVASAAGTQARFYLRGKTDLAKDYQAVFHQFAPPFSQFAYIGEVGGSRESRSLGPGVPTCGVILMSFGGPPRCRKPGPRSFVHPPPLFCTERMWRYLALTKYHEHGVPPGPQQTQTPLDQSCLARVYPIESMS